MELTQVKSAIAAQLERAKKSLRNSKGPADESIHTARKALKRARSGLRLLRPAMPPADYEHENAGLRKIGRQLSAVRDDKVQYEALCALIAAERDPRRRRILERLRAETGRARRKHWQAMQAVDAVPHIKQALAASAARVPGLSEAGAPTPLVDAARKLYRKSRKALKRSRKSRADEDLHEARKELKRLANAVELLSGGKDSPAISPRAKKVLKRASRVGDWLGEDHDLALVEARLRRLRNAPKDVRRDVTAKLDKRRGRLQKKALRRARTVLGKKTKKLLVRLSAA